MSRFESGHFMDHVPTRPVFFAAMDIDCDGTSTAIYRVPVARDIVLAEGDHMPLDIWTEIFDGSSYFNHDDIFVITDLMAYRALATQRPVIGEGPAEFSKHGDDRYEYVSVWGRVE